MTKETIADLSFQINKLESSLREFEKQKVNPKFEEVAREISECYERINDLENINAEKRLINLESKKLTNQLNPQVWDYVVQKLDKLESMCSMLDLMIKSKECGVGMEQDNKWMECLNSLEAKMQSKIDGMMEIFKCNSAADQFCQSSKPYICPVCNGCGNSKGAIESNPDFDFFIKYSHCHACEGNGVLWSPKK